MAAAGTLRAGIVGLSGIGANPALGAAMVKEIDVDLSRTAESLALALVRHYRVDLDPAAKRFLIAQYGARETTLNMLSTANEAYADSRMLRNAKYTVPKHIASSSGMMMRSNFGQMSWIASRLSWSSK